MGCYQESQHHKHIFTSILGSWINSNAAVVINSLMSVSWISQSVHRVQQVISCWWLSESVVSSPIGQFGLFNIIPLSSSFSPHLGYPFVVIRQPHLSSYSPYCYRGVFSQTLVLFLPPSMSVRLTFALYKTLWNTLLCLISRPLHAAFTHKLFRFYRFLCAW